MISVAFALAFQLAVQSTGEQHEERARSYYASRLPNPPTTIFHGIHVVGERPFEDSSATVVCVNYSTKLRFGIRTTQTEALWFRGDEVVLREGAMEAVHTCMVMMFGDSRVG